MVLIRIEEVLTMSKQASLRRNIFFQTAYQILNTCLPLITAPYLARVLGAEQLGIFSYSSSVVSYFTLICMLGTVNYGTRSIASVKEDKVKVSFTFWSIYGFQALLTCIVLVFYQLYLLFFCVENKCIAIIQTISIVDCLLNINWLFFGLEKFQFTVTRSFFVRVFTVVAILSFVNEPTDLWVYTLIMTGGSLLSNAVLWVSLPRVVNKVKVKVKDYLPHLKPNLILFIPLLAMSVYHAMDKTMLGLLSTYEQSGFYYNVDKVINIPVGILTGISTVLLPRMTAFVSAGKKKEGDKLFRESLEFVIALSVAIAFGISAIAKEFTPVFFGTGYDECVLLIIALSPVLVIKGVSISARTQYLIPYKLEIIFIRSVVMGAAVNLIINWTLIPKYGAMGAVIGTLVAELTACVMQLWTMRKYLKLNTIYKNTLVYLIIGISMFVCVRLIARLQVNIYFKLSLEVICGATIYSGLSILFWKLTKNIMYREVVYGLLNRLKKRERNTSIGDYNA